MNWRTPMPFRPRFAAQPAVPIGLITRSVWLSARRNGLFFDTLPFSRGLSKRQLYGQAQRFRDPRRLHQLQQEADAAPHNPRAQAALYQVHTQSASLCMARLLTPAMPCSIGLAIGIASSKAEYRSHLTLRGRPLCCRRGVLSPLRCCSRRNRPAK